MKTIREVEYREKALFSQRVIAYIIDTILLFMLTSLILTPFNTGNENYERLQTELSDSAESFAKQDIDIKTYFTRSIEIGYDIAREWAPLTILEVLIIVIYFIVLPFYSKGQTFGKKLMKIKVVPKDSKKLTMNNLLFRSLIINSIVVTMVTLVFTLLSSKNVYFVGSIVFQIIDFILIIACLISAAVREDGRGIHDLFANTMVIKANDMLKEEVTCES